jgi:hypothetical protein
MALVGKGSSMERLLIIPLIVQRKNRLLAGVKKKGLWMSLGKPLCPSARDPVFDKRFRPVSN